MAEKRMFNRKFFEQYKFGCMPAEAKVLYFYLNLYADDDGVVEAWNVMKLANASDDSLRILISKGFINLIVPDDMVAYITDWKLHNTIRSDRYVKSLHHDLLVKLIPEAQISFAQRKEKSLPEPYGIPEVNQLDTNGKRSIDKNSKDKNNKAVPGLNELCSGIASVMADVPTTPDQINELHEAIEAYCQMRKAQRKPLQTQRAVNGIIKKLVAYSAKNYEAMIAVLDHSTNCSYIDVFPLKNVAPPQALPPAESGRGGRKMSPV